MKRSAIPAMTRPARALRPGLVLAVFLLLLTAALPGCTHPEGRDPIPPSDRPTSGTTVSGSTTTAVPPTLTTSTSLAFTYTSREGRSIEVLVFGKGGPVALVLGGFHGDEPQGVRLAQEIAAHLAVQPTALAGGSVAVVPCVNPDGLERGTRQNAAGIDLNRNFPTEDFGLPGNGGGSAEEGLGGRYYGGESPASEPETRAVLDLVERLDPALVLTIHAPLACVNYDGPAEAVAQTLAGLTGLPLSDDIGYSTPGSLGTYLGEERGVPVITLELGPDLGDAAGPTHAVVGLLSSHLADLYDQATGQAAEALARLFAAWAAKDEAAAERALTPDRRGLTWGFDSMESVEFGPLLAAPEEIDSYLTFGRGSVNGVGWGEVRCFRAAATFSFKPGAGTGPATRSSETYEWLWFVVRGPDRLWRVDDWGY